MPSGAALSAVAPGDVELPVGEHVDGVDVELDIADVYVSVMTAGEVFLGLIEFDC